MATNLIPLKVPVEVRNKVGFQTDQFLNDLVFGLNQLRTSDSSGGGTGPAEPGNTTNNDYSVSFTDSRTVIARTITQSTTLTDFEFVNAKNGITVTFPQYPVENSFVIVRNGDGSRISLDGNGKNINGSSSGVIRRYSTSIEFYYFVDDDEWFAR